MSKNTSFDQQVNQRLDVLIEKLAKDFSLEKLSKSPARFSLEKLNWFNRQYLQMMSLEEFAYRASKLRTEKTNPDKKLRIGDYVALVDLEREKIFVQINKEENGLRYALLGGGREEAESWQDCLSREVEEETNGKIKIDLEKVLKITQFERILDFGQPQWDGKMMHVYFYPLKTTELERITLREDKFADWIDLADYFNKTKLLNFPIWKNFCQSNLLPLFTPNEEILTQYLAWQLDKGRVTTLSEVGF